MEIRKQVLPVLKPSGGEEEIQAISEVIKSGWWGKGPKVAEFEKEFAKYIGVAHAIEPGKKEFHVELPYSLGAKICVGDAIRPTSLRTKQVGDGGLRQQHRPSWHRPNRFG